MRVLPTALAAFAAIVSPAAAAAPRFSHVDRLTERTPTGLRAFAPRSAPSPVSMPGIASTWCGENLAPGEPGRATDDDTHETGNRGVWKIHVLYVWPSDKTNRMTLFANQIQSVVKDVSEQLAGEADKSFRFDLGTVCGPQNVDITTVQLPKPTASYGMDTSSGGLAQLAADTPATISIANRNKRIWLFIVDLPVSGIPGIGPLSEPLGTPEWDGHLGDKYVFIGANDSWADGSAGPAADREGVVLHELGHALGAVGAHAPHANATFDNGPGRLTAGHCFDEWDVMCYDDDGDPSTFPLTFPCAGSDGDQVFDCNRDDYFNPSPPAGSPLALGGTVFNTYRSDFLCPTAECTPTAISPVLPDEDGDGVNDVTDNCVGLANPDQSNWEPDHDVRESWDAYGDPCDADDDNDRVLDVDDPCPHHKFTSYCPTPVPPGFYPDGTPIGGPKKPATPKPTTMPATAKTISVRLANPARHGKSTLTVTVPDIGALEVRQAASGTTMIKSVRRTVRAGAVKVKLALTRAGAKRVRAARRVSMRVRVAFTAAGQKPIVKFVRVRFRW